MAIIKCHECGGQVSSQAAACPNCGAPPRMNDKTDHPQSRIVQYGGGFIAVVFAFAFSSTTGILDGVLNSSIWGRPGGPVHKVAFSTLLSDYDSNVVAADGRYKGKSISTTANLVSIDTGLGGDLKLMLNNGPWSFKFADAYLLPSQRDAASRLKESSPVNLLCVVSGGPGGRPQLRRCVIQ